LLREYYHLKSGFSAPIHFSALCRRLWLDRLSVTSQSTAKVVRDMPVVILGSL